MSTMVTPLFAALLDALEHEVDDERREAERHLVGDDQLRRHRERAGEREHLLLTAGERAGALAAPLGETREHLVRVLDRRLALVGRADPAHRHAQVLLHREAGEDPATLGDVHEPGAADRRAVAPW